MAGFLIFGIHEKKSNHVPALHFFLVAIHCGDLPTYLGKQKNDEDAISDISVVK